MSLEKEDFDPRADQIVTKLWYRDDSGDTAQVVKYSDPFGGFARKEESSDVAEKAPLYVSLRGRQPEPLIKVLQELEQLRNWASRTKEEAHTAELEKLEELDNRLETVEKKLTNKKKWWQK